MPHSQVGLWWQILHPENLQQPDKCPKGDGHTWNWLIQENKVVQARHLTFLVKAVTCYYSFKHYKKLNTGGWWWRDQSKPPLLPTPPHPSPSFAWKYAFQYICCQQEWRTDNLNLQTYFVLYTDRSWLVSSFFSALDNSRSTDEKSEADSNSKPSLLIFFVFLANAPEM